MIGHSNCRPKIAFDTMHIATYISRAFQFQCRFDHVLQYPNSKPMGDEERLLTAQKEDGLI